MTQTRDRGSCENALMHRLAILACVISACSAPPPPKPPCDATQVTKGPWVLRATETGAVVRWESRAAGCVEVGLLPEDAGAETKESVVAGTATPTVVTTAYGAEVGFSPADEAGTFFVNEVPLTGLSPGTCYAYRLAGVERRGRFCTARPPGQPIRFLALGDSASRWGELEKLEAHLPPRPDFVVHLGDIQYYASILETWQSWFRDAAPLLQAGAFYPCIGNHELELTGELEDYYLRLFASPGDGTPRWYRFSSGGVAFFALDTESSLAAGSEQVAWLTQALADAKATPGWKLSVVFFHKPLYTLSQHDPLTDVRAVLEPLFAANGVKLVLQGHNHVYERFEVGDVTWITSGGGGAPLYGTDTNASSYANDALLRQAAASQYHALEISIGDTLVIRALDESGAELDRSERSYR